MSTIAVLSADTVYRQPMQGGLCKKAANKGHAAFLEGENRGGIHVFDAFWRAGCYFLRHPTAQGGSLRGLPLRPGRLRVLLPSPPEPWAGFCRAANRQYKGMPPPAFFGNRPEYWLCIAWLPCPANAPRRYRTWCFHFRRYRHEIVFPSVLLRCTRTVGYCAWGCPSAHRW